MIFLLKTPPSQQFNNKHVVICKFLMRNQMFLYCFANLQNMQDFLFKYT